MTRVKGSGTNPIPPGHSRRNSSEREDEHGIVRVIMK